jgi:hypothetical protein
MEDTVQNIYKKDKINIFFYIWKIFLIIWAYNVHWFQRSMRLVNSIDSIHIDRNQTFDLYQPLLRHCNFTINYYINSFKM